MKNCRESDCRRPTERSFSPALDPRGRRVGTDSNGAGLYADQPLGLPLYQEPDYLARAIECMLHCLIKTDV